MPYNEGRLPYTHWQGCETFICKLFITQIYPMRNKMSDKRAFPNGAVPAEYLKRINPSPGVYDFRNMPKMHADESLVERVRLSMCKNLRREITEQEARNYLKICGAFASASRSKPSAKPSKESKPGKRLFSLDEMAADNGAIKLFTDWVPWWGCIQDGRIMASAADVYTGVKEMISAYKSGASSASDLMSSLKKDMRLEEGLIVDTEVNYLGPKPNNCQTSIITHRGNCQYRKEAEKLTVFEPKYASPIENVIEFGNKGGTEFLQALFCTRDKPKEISKSLGFVTGVTTDKIYISVPSEDSRKTDPHRIAGLSISLGALFIYVTIEPNNLGEARGRSRGFFLH